MRTQPFDQDSGRVPLDSCSDKRLGSASSCEALSLATGDSGLLPLSWQLCALLRVHLSVRAIRSRGIPEPEAAIEPLSAPAYEHNIDMYTPRYAFATGTTQTGALSVESDWDKAQGTKPRWMAFCFHKESAVLAAPRFSNCGLQRTHVRPASGTVDPMLIAPLADGRWSRHDLQQGAAFPGCLVISRRSLRVPHQQRSDPTAANGGRGGGLGDGALLEQRANMHKQLCARPIAMTPSALSRGQRASGAGGG